MFGSDYGDILSHQECPNCGAPAVIRGMLRPHDVVICHLTCNKCHEARFIGFTSLKSIAFEKLKDRLLRLRERTDAMGQATIDRNLKKLEERRKYEELGL